MSLKQIYMFEVSPGDFSHLRFLHSHLLLSLFCKNVPSFHFIIRLKKGTSWIGELGPNLESPGTPCENPVYRLQNIEVSVNLT